MSTGEDKRRRRYVPVDVLVAFSPFGGKLADKWGMEGLCAWMLLLAAAKREPVQGTFTYTSEAEAWTKLGVTATSFTFEEFITFCGRAKQTRKTRSGRITYVDLTGWQGWNDAWKREQDTERKSRKRAQSTPDKPATIRGTYADDARTEVEAEVEDEVEAEAREPEPHPGLPISVEKNIELERLLRAVRGADENSLQVLQAAARGVSYAGICRVRESCELKRPVPGVGYAVNALKSEARQAA